MANIKAAEQNLPKRFSKFVVQKLSNDFKDATELVTVEFQTLLDNLKPNQVIVRNHYLGINASDINFTAGRYDTTLKPPFDCGFESMGVVVVTGKETSIALNQCVAAITYGAFTEYQVLYEAMLIPLPALEKRFLGLLVSGLTSSLALEYHGHMKSNETVLVTAAAGGAGQIAVQLAKLAGNHVIGTCSSEEKSAFLKSIGCDRVVNYKKEKLGQVLKKEYPKGVDIVYESVGGEMFQDAMKALAIRGRMIIIGAISNYSKKVEDETKTNTLSAVWNDQVATASLLWKSTTVTGFFLSNYTNEMPAHMLKLTDLVQKGKLFVQTHPEPFIGLKSVPDAIQLMHSGKNVGKLVVDLIPKSAL